MGLLRVPDSRVWPRCTRILARGTPIAINSSSASKPGYVAPPRTSLAMMLGRDRIGAASAWTPLGVRKPATILAFWQFESFELINDEISFWGVSNRTVAFTLNEGIG